MGARVLFRASQAWVEGRMQAAGVVVRDGRIVEVLASGIDAELLGSVDDVVDVPEGAVLLPGLIDTHVHVNEPGRTEWEGFASATRAAALGGVTTIVDMPLNSIPATTTVEALAEKKRSAEGRVAVDVGFWGGAVPDSLGSLGAMWDAGVYGFKCFLAPSGVDEFPHLSGDQLLAAMREVATLGAPLIVHAEDPAHLHANGALGTHYRDFLASRPPEAERDAIQRVIDGVRATGARVHILHLSDASALPAIRAAKAEGLPLTVETCPHYLTIDADAIPDGAAEFKCCPPIRGRANQDALWAGLLDGTIDLVVTDHSPSTVEMKRAHGGDFGLAWGGIAGLQVGFRAVWAAAIRRGIGLDAILPWFTTGPARLVGMRDRGEITVGSVAHLTVFDPAAIETIAADQLEHRNKISAYDGVMVSGRFVQTWLHGAQIASADGGIAAVEGDLLVRQGAVVHAAETHA